MNRKGRLLCAAVMAAQLAFHAGALARPVERAAETYESGRLGAALLALIPLGVSMQLPEGYEAVASCRL